VRRIREALQRRFEEIGDETGQQALARVEDPPVGPEHVKALTQAVDASAALDPSFADALKQLLEEAKATGINVEHVAQSIVGDHNIQIQGTENSQINIHK